MCYLIYNCCTVWFYFIKSKLIVVQRGLSHSKCITGKMKSNVFCYLAVLFHILCLDYVVWFMFDMLINHYV